MCIFSGRVDSVSKTNIFARIDKGVQHLIYSMNFSAPEPVAMILPLPIKSGMEPTFRNLEDYPHIFADIKKAFPEIHSKRMTRGASRGGRSFGMLAVEEVGSFIASFVPSISDFDRLDPRFRIPRGAEGAMTKLYADFGFAVFQLRAGNDVKQHPMALSFQTGEEGSVFFPTVHVHAGRVPDDEEFDHTLYLQMPPGMVIQSQDEHNADVAWTMSAKPLGAEVKLDKVPGEMIRNSLGYQRSIRGYNRNVDIRFDVVKNGCVA